jgi:hypothetical protein
LAFFTPAGKNVKLWNALTGDIKKIFSDLTPTEITCFSLDKLKKRMLSKLNLKNFIKANKKSFKKKGD